MNRWSETGTMSSSLWWADAQSTVSSIAPCSPFLCFTACSKKKEWDHHCHMTHDCRWRATWHSHAIFVMYSRFTDEGGIDPVLSLVRLSILKKYACAQSPSHFNPCCKDGIRLLLMSSKDNNEQERQSKISRTGGFLIGRGPNFVFLFYFAFLISFKTLWGFGERNN